VVIGARDQDARATLAGIAAQRRSAAMMIDRDFSYFSHAPAHRLDYTGLGINMRDVELGVAGRFQHENAAIALAAVEALRGAGWRLDEPQIRRGLASLQWPGRFDIVRRRPLVVLDCAHNELSIEALLDTIAVELGADARPRLVFGCLSDKNWARMAQMLGPRVRDVTLTRVKPKRPLEPERLVEHFASYAPTRVIAEPLEAIGQVMAEAGEEDFVLATGSVYLIGEIYPHFLAAEGRTRLFPEAI
jgi:dihydrofolate synthase/folylpolyglutamate synthase